MTKTKPICNSVYAGTSRKVFFRIGVATYVKLQNSTNLLMNYHLILEVFNASIS